MQLNRPSPEGYELGQHFARFADQEAEAHPEKKHRCDTCAFRKGTPANGSVPTLANAIKCVFEREPFYCHEHEREGQPCAGWALLVRDGSAPPIKMPWDYVDGYSTKEVLDALAALDPAEAAAAMRELVG
jgi:hypothetical protein